MCEARVETADRNRLERTMQTTNILDFASASPKRPPTLTGRMTTRRHFVDIDISVIAERELSWNSQAFLNIYSSTQISYAHQRRFLKNPQCDWSTNRERQSAASEEQHWRYQCHGVLVQAFLCGAKCDLSNSDAPLGSARCGPSLRRTTVSHPHALHQSLLC